MLPIKDEGYFRSILSRAGEGIVPQFIEVTCGGKPPVEAQCHANVDTYASENMGFTAVRGWLIESNASRLAAHSVLEDARGELFEITVRHNFAFVRHIGAEAEFVRISQKHPAMPYQCRSAGDG